MTDKWALVVRLGGIGDNLIASSVCPVLKRQGYKVAFMTVAPDGEVLENNPHIDRLITRHHSDTDVPKGGVDWQKYFVSKGMDYDLFLNLSSTIEVRAAFRPDQTWFWWPQEARRKLANVNYVEAAHDVGSLPHECEVRFYPTKEEVEQAKATKKRVGPRACGIVVAGSGIDKMYPFLDSLVPRIIAELKLPVILFAGTGEAEGKVVHAIRAQVTERLGSLADLHIASSRYPKGIGPHQWPARRAISLLHQCDLVIGPDTGLMWGVSFERMPKIMLLSHASPENITKRWINTTTLHADAREVPCWPCHRLHAETTTCVNRPDGPAFDAACISSINIETIMSTAKQLLTKEKSNGSLKVHAEGRARLGVRRRDPHPPGVVVRRARHHHAHR